MSRLLTVLLLSFLTLPMMAASVSPFAGTWEGTTNSQPAIELTIADTGGRISGIASFYFQTVGEDGKWHVRRKHSTPMLTPTITGKILAFEVAHHKKPRGAELGPNVRFTMELTGPNEAAFHKLEAQRSEGPGLTLKRRR